MSYLCKINLFTQYALLGCADTRIPCVNRFRNASIHIVKRKRFASENIDDRY